MASTVKSLYIYVSCFHPINCAIVATTPNEYLCGLLDDIAWEDMNKNHFDMTQRLYRFILLTAALAICCCVPGTCNNNKLHIHTQILIAYSIHISATHTYKQATFVTEFSRPSPCEPLPSKWFVANASRAVRVCII